MPNNNQHQRMMQSLNNDDQQPDTIRGRYQGGVSRSATGTSPGNGAGTTPEGTIIDKGGNSVGS
jgi:hypothetical protein